MLKVKRLEGKVDQIKIMESKMFHYACVCIHASLTFVYHDNRDLSLCCSASEYAEIGYTKSGFSFALKNLLPNVHVRIHIYTNDCFCVKHMCSYSGNDHHNIKVL